MHWLGSRLFTVVAAVALLLTGSVLISSLSSTMRLPDNHQGYEPVQPIAYSHRLHAGELDIPCLHCHHGAERSKTAGIPSTNVCMNCHSFVTAPWVNIKAEGDLASKEMRKAQLLVSPELRKLFTHAGLDEHLKPSPDITPTPIAWTKVHNLQAFVSFDHSAHVNAGVDCQTCHGAVETMERVRQVSDLSMGWCVNCHRDANLKGIKGKKVKASTDCVTCHY